jgi:ATP-binding cassette subfamily F protein 3
MEIREEEIRRQAKRYELQQKEIARQEDFIRKNIVDKKTTKRAQSRRKMLERMERIERPDSDAAATRVRIEPQVLGGRDVLRATDVGAEIAGRTLFSGVNLEIRRGDRLGVLGPNGSGKTTLLNILAGRRTPDAGSLRLGVGILPGVLDQELASLHDANSVVDELHALRPVAPQREIRSYLARFLFRGEDVFKIIGSLSGGERSRVAIAKLFLEGPNLLFLDEPTNHLDIDGRRALEDALEEYTGTVIAVSHDRYFLNRFAKAILHVHDGGARFHIGNFDDFRARQTEIARESTADASEGALRYEERKRLKREREKRERERKRREDRMAEIEREIQRLDGDMGRTAEALSQPGLEAERLRELSDAHRALDSERSALYAEWERLVDELARDDHAGDGAGPEGDGSS